MHLDSVVKIKSLPFDANQLDIIHFFEEYRLKPNGVQLVVRSDNKPTGEVCSPRSGSCGVADERQPQMRPVCMLFRCRRSFNPPVDTQHTHARTHAGVCGL
jgi:hypothetical protein